MISARHEKEHRAADRSANGNIHLECRQLSPFWKALLKQGFDSRETFEDVVDPVTVGGDLSHGPAENWPPKPLQRSCLGVAPLGSLRPAQAP